MGNHLEGSGRGLIFRYYSGSHLEGLRKTKINLDQDSRSPGRNLNLGPPEYEAGILTTRPRRSVMFLEKLVVAHLMEKVLILRNLKVHYHVHRTPPLDTL
jgi:hypothetical protein